MSWAHICCLRRCGTGPESPTPFHFALKCKPNLFFIFHTFTHVSQKQQHNIVCESEQETVCMCACARARVMVPAAEQLLLSTQADHCGADDALCPRGPRRAMLVDRSWEDRNMNDKRNEFHQLPFDSSAGMQRMLMHESRLSHQDSLLSHGFII